MCTLGTVCRFGCARVLHQLRAPSLDTLLISAKLCFGCASYNLLLLVQMCLGFWQHSYTGHKSYPDYHSWPVET